MVGWPTKTPPVNTIDLPPSDDREVEGWEADGKNRKKNEARRRQVSPWLGATRLLVVQIKFHNQGQSFLRLYFTIFIHPAK